MNNRRISEQEWATLPITFGSDVMAHLIGSNQRYVTNHAEALGGLKVAGKWLFAKPRVAVLLGIAETR